MVDPTQTQPLPWTAEEAKKRPWEKSSGDSRDPASPGASPPDRLADRGYRLRARIGSGRLGAIYEAQDDLSRSSGSQHFVAIQLIDERIAARAGFADEFERGARELRSLAHPNIVKLLEYGRDGERYYLAMELLESASLRFVLNDVTSLPLEETNAVLRAVGDALLYLHAKPMIHGNLTPANVLVTFGYEVKLLDLVPAGWLDGPRDEFGELIRRPDKRDDVFGLACLAYEMLTGRHPYNGNTAQEAYQAGLEPAPVEGISARQWRALAGALAVHRDDRTPNVRQFLEEFGVTRVERLKQVVGPDAPPAESPAPDFGSPAGRAAEPARARRAPDAPKRPAARAEPEPEPRIAYEDPAPLPSVLAERVVPLEERRSGIGRLLLLLVVLGAGAAAWWYRAPLTEGASAFLSEVDTGLSRERAASETATRDVSPDREEPLTQAAPVSDPDPATVIAPGARLPEGIGNTGRPVPPTVAPPPAEEGAPPAGETAAAAPAPDESATAPADPGIGPATSAVAPTALPPAPEAPTPAGPTPAGPTRFSFAESSLAVRESDVAARIVILRSGDLSGPASVAWWTAEGTARADVDYADLGARVERFEAGERSRVVLVPLINDAIPEPDKVFNVYLGRGDFAADGEPASGTRVEIKDDD